MVIGMSVMFKTQITGQPAFMINQDNDTIMGLVSVKNRGKADMKCFFKKNKQDAGINLSPSNTVGFQLKNKKFFKSIDTSTTEETKFIFAHLLVRSRISLYRFDDMYYMEKEGELYALNLDTSETPSTGYWVIHTSRKYLRVINYLMSDCNGLSTEIQKTLFTPKSLENIVSLYNLCHNAPSVDYPN